MRSYGFVDGILLDPIRADGIHDMKVPNAGAQLQQISSAVDAKRVSDVQHHYPTSAVFFVNLSHKCWRTANGVLSRFPDFQKPAGLIQWTFRLTNAKKGLAERIFSLIAMHTNVSVLTLTHEAQHDQALEDKTLLKTHPNLSTISYISHFGSSLGLSHDLRFAGRFYTRKLIQSLL